MNRGQAGTDLGAGKLELGAGAWSWELWELSIYHCLLYKARARLAGGGPRLARIADELSEVRWWVLYLTVGGGWVGSVGMTRAR